MALSVMLKKDVEKKKGDNDDEEEENTSPFRPNIKVHIVCAGILYGLGEETFHNHFKHAWLQNPEELPYLGDGSNIMPTIHKIDLVNLVYKITQDFAEFTPET